MIDTAKRRNLLRQFDRLTLKLSHPDQMERINARLKLAAMQRAYGESTCQAMFEQLKRRDARRAK